MPSLRMAVLLLGLALPAAAQSPETVQRAKEAYLAGQSLYKEGRYREAASRFEEANFLSPRAGNWFNIARCYEQVGEVAKALSAFRSYLRESPAAAEKASVEASIRKLQAALKASGVQQLTVLVDPRDLKATVSVDGRVVGVAPVTVELPRGTRVVRAEAGGYTPLERKVEVSLEAASDVTLVLVAAPAAVPVAGGRDTPVQPSFTPNAFPEPPPPPPLTGVEAARKPYVLAWVGTAATVAAIATGAILHGLAAGVQADLRTPAGGTPRSFDDNQKLYNQGVGLQTGAFVGYGAAGALGIGTALLFVFEGK